MRHTLIQHEHMMNGDEELAIPVDITFSEPEIDLLVDGKYHVKLCLQQNFLMIKSDRGRIELGFYPFTNGERWPGGDGSYIKPFDWDDRQWVRVRRSEAEAAE